MDKLSVRLLHYITRMLHLRVLLLFSFFVGISGNLQDINVALQNNGGKCDVPFAATSCYRLIDGVKEGGSDFHWKATGNITNEYITLSFKSVAEIKRIEVASAYNIKNRNIKYLRIEIDNNTPLTGQLGLMFNGTGYGTDIFTISQPIQTDYLKLVIADIKDSSNEATSVIMEIEVYGIFIQTTQMTTLISPTTEPATESHEVTTPESPETSTTSLTITLTTTTPSATSTSARTTESTTATTQLSSTLQYANPSAPSAVTPITEIATYTTTNSLANIFVSSKGETTLSTENTSRPISLTEEGEQALKGIHLGPIIGPVISFLVIVAVVLVVLFFVLRRNKRRKFGYQDTDQNGYVNVVMDKIDRAPEAEKNIKNQITVVEPHKEDNLTDSSHGMSPESVQDLKLVDGEPESTKTQLLPVYSNAIKLDDLASTVDDMLQNPVTFQDEFKSIPAGKQHPTTFADRSTLHVKNRFRNIKPYDHSRVSLIQKESDDSMYINANFISAYNQPKYYIAAQGPNKDSVDDFWRMIWEHRVPVIVMVTNCKEAGKDKCTKYWPDQGDDKQTYDDVDVVFDKNSIMADYKIRDFKISKRGEIRTVRQYHYTSWPDEGVPTSCSALISFVNRIREYTDDKDPPNVVHCSAGVGRTGTFIAVNYSMDIAREESIVDIKKVVHRLREDRINMVQTLSQYKFLYALMLECLYCGEVTIPCQGATEKIQHIFIQADGKYSQAEKQWKVLDVLKPKNWEDECLAGRHKDNIKKNRTQTILPHDNHRPYLRRRPDYTSNYINAVFVDGYKKKNKFLLTQHPLENTVVDLWRTVSDFNISTIVMLNSCSDDAEVYWPEDEYSEALQYGDFLEVTFKRVDKQDEFTITEVQMFEDKEKANVVTHIQVKNWSEDSKPKLSILPALYNIVTQAQMADEDSRIMIHNLNGDGNTGVYCALHQIFDKIKEEQEIDIFNAVKNTRMSRPDAIPDMKTYRYLHDASVQFIEQFSTYANLQ